MEAQLSLLYLVLNRTEALGPTQVEVKGKQAILWNDRTNGNCRTFPILYRRTPKSGEITSLSVLAVPKTQHLSSCFHNFQR